MVTGSLTVTALTRDLIIPIPAVKIKLVLFIFVHLTGFVKGGKKASMFHVFLLMSRQHSAFLKTCEASDRLRSHLPKDIFFFPQIENKTSNQFWES